MKFKVSLWKLTLWMFLFQNIRNKLSIEEENKAKDLFVLEMEHRNLNNIEQMVNEIFIPNNINVTSELENLKLDILQDLNEFEAKLKPKKQAQVVRPVFKWGQTFRKIYIHLKYSHRFDAPGCLDVYNQTLEISTDDKRSVPSESKKMDIDDESEDQNAEETTFTGTIKGEAQGTRFKFSAECQVADSVFKYLVELDLLHQVTRWSIDKGGVH